MAAPYYLRFRAIARALRPSFAPLRRLRDIFLLAQPGIRLELFKRQLKVAAGFEIETVGAHELALLLVERRPTVWAGTFDLLFF